MSTGPDLSGAMSSRDAADHDAIERQLAACRRLLDAVGAYQTDWRGRGGRPMSDHADVLLHTFFARSTRTFEAIVHLGTRGFGEQAAMLNRSLFEDMVDAHWVSVRRELALERLAQHHRYSNRLKLDVAAGFPHFFGTELPEQDPPMDEEERQALKRIFGTYGQKSWTGLSLHERFAAIESCWTDEVSRQHARFFHLWVHRENNETLHPSAYSLTKLGGPEAVGENELHYLSGASEHLVGHALFCAFWTYSQTAWLLLEAGGFDLGELERKVYEPGLAVLADAMRPTTPPDSRETREQASDPASRSPDWANEQFMTPNEAAKLLRLNRQTIYNWVDAGTLPAVRVGRRVRILRYDLDRLIESGYRNGKPAPKTGDR